MCCVERERSINAYRRQSRRDHTIDLYLNADRYQHSRAGGRHNSTMPNRWIRPVATTKGVVRHLVVSDQLHERQMLLRHRRVICQRDERGYGLAALPIADGVERTKEAETFDLRHL